MGDLTLPFEEAAVPLGVVEDIYKGSNKGEAHIMETFKCVNKTAGIMQVIFYVETKISINFQLLPRSKLTLFSLVILSLFALHTLHTSRVFRQVLSIQIQPFVEESTLPKVKNHVFNFYTLLIFYKTSECYHPTNVLLHLLFTLQAKKKLMRTPLTDLQRRSQN